jgi:NAD(P)-dependent dehydrogenase (short-subunit alcohol dehydrogenase family)
VPTPRIAVVTGAAAGIGWAIARRLGADGCSVVVADVDADGAQRRADELTAAGVDAWSVAVDVADEASVAAMATAALERAGGVNILVNNAGITGRHRPFAEYPLAELRRILDIDLVGTMMVTQAFLPAMLAAGSGRIVNMASIAGKDGNPRLAPYAAAKAGVIAFTKSIGRELADTGIVVNAVAPGGVGGTDITKAVGEAAPVAADQAARVKASTPMGRLATPDEVAALVAWLCSPECSYSTGSVYDISGGRATY